VKRGMFACAEHVCAKVRIRMEGACIVDSGIWGLGGGDCDRGYLICILFVSSTGWAKLLAVFMLGSNDVLDVIGETVVKTSFAASSI